MHQGKILKSLLEDKGMKVADFANKIGVVRQTVSNYFKMKFLKEDFIEDACKILDVKKELFYLDETKQYKEKYINAIEELLQAQKKIIELEEEVKSLYKKSN